MPPKGHRNLSIRGCCTYCQCVLTLINICYEGNLPMDIPMAIFQFWAGTTLIVQWHTANPKMFLARAVPSYLRFLLAGYGAVCGRRWPWEECNDSPWQDYRSPLRVLQCYASMRFFLNGLSLTLQYFYPKRGVGARGNEQLFYRGIIRLTGVPLQLFRAMIKLGTLTGTQHERMSTEIAVNLVNGIIVIPVAAWSLLNQWATSGTGRKTDDDRTNMQGTLVFGSPDSIADFLEPHKGDRDLLIRSALEFVQVFFILWLVAYEVDPFHYLVESICQAVTAAALFYQWRRDHHSTHYVRALASFATIPSFIHLVICGRVWPWEECDVDGWSDMRKPFRMITVLVAMKSFVNGVSLVCQIRYPTRGVTRMYGHEQLLYRSIIRFAGVPLYLVTTLHLFAELSHTQWERPAIELIVLLLRSGLAALLASSLMHQWRYSGLDTQARCTPQATATAPPSPSNTLPATSSKDMETQTCSDISDGIRDGKQNGNLANADTISKAPDEPVICSSLMSERREITAPKACANV